MDLVLAERLAQALRRRAVAETMLIDTLGSGRADDDIRRADYARGYFEAVQELNDLFIEDRRRTRPLGRPTNNQEYT